MSLAVLDSFICTLRLCTNFDDCLAQTFLVAAYNLATPANASSRNKYGMITTQNDTTIRGNYTICGRNYSQLRISIRHS